MGSAPSRGVGVRSLAITADDYGLDAAVNRGIEVLAASGYITGTSVMLHAEAVLDRVDHLNGQTSLGVHLTLVEERPLLAGDSGLAPLLDADGRLPRNYRSLFAQVLARPAVLPALAREAAAQVERFLSLGLKLDFINSHQHVHLFPPIWLALFPLLKRYPVAVRGSRRLPKLGFSSQALVNLAAWISWWLRPLPKHPTTHPLGISAAGKLTLESAAKSVSEAVALYDDVDGIVPELVTHPGHVSPAMEVRYPHWNYHWQEELELLRSEAFKELIEGAGFVLSAVNLGGEVVGDG